MDNRNSSQQQPSTQQQQQSSSKNVRNLSIKEFFTSRLMRARSFEGGANSPKDETSNWFDEFKARMSKKSAQAKQLASSDGNTTDNNSEEFVESSESVRNTSQSKSGKLYHKDDPSTTLVKEACDNLENLTTSAESFDDTTLTVDDSQNHLCKTSTDVDDFDDDGFNRSGATSVISSGLRSRKSKKISCTDSPDFDTASINTIFNRRDSRYDSISRKRQKPGMLTRLPVNFRWILSYLIPFNYNLPWKLFSLISLSFAIIVLTVVSRSSPDLMTFSFFNGFISGLVVATICFSIITISLLATFIPVSQKSHATNDAQAPYVNRSASRSGTPNMGMVNVASKTVSFDSSSTKKRQDLYPIEVLGEDNRDADGENDLTKNDNLLDDDDYKGWMIEFIGDYELRNKSDFKLKLIFVRVEERILHLCKPKNNHDAESTTFPVFVNQRAYDLNTVRKFSANLLLPKTVRNRQKWVWSKKYPIRLEFLEESAEATKSNESPRFVQLTLFAKSCREKEEWFRRFKRIVDEQKLAQMLVNKRSSLKSNLSDGNGESSQVCSDSMKSCCSISSTPSSRKDCVQTSRSSHLLGDQLRVIDDDIEQPEATSSGLHRTKSCEHLHPEKTPSTGTRSISGYGIEDEDIIHEQDTRDDSTLTKETAELFSQAIEYSNFIDSQPTLCYKDYIERVIESGQDATATSDWFNALTGRIFFDVLSHNYWSIWFKRKIQRKLYRIRLPYFMETLTLTQIDLGSNAPQFLNVGSHSFDSFGLSIDFDMSYSGGLTMTFETKLNLLKIKTDNSANSSSNINSAQPPPSEPGSANDASTSDVASKESTSSNTSSSENVNFSSHKPVPSSSASTRTSGESSESDQSDSDSSSESSIDGAEVDEISDWEDYGAEKTRQSIVKFVDKIASSRYFQHATENRYIKKKLQDISNCPLMLIVKIQSLNGVLTVNVPPPQTDRIWYGFKPNPELTLKALPKMGDREVNLSHVTDWIERKLSEEFRKILVIPNMEDIVLPVLKSDHLTYITPTK